MKLSSLGGNLMAKLQLQSQVSVNNQSLTVESLIHELLILSPELYVSVFSEANIKLPKSIRMDVIRTLLETHVKQTRKDRFSLADELNYRLKWFYQYSEYQYVNLLSFYENPKLIQSYVEHLLVAIFEFLVDSKKESVIQKMLDAKKSQANGYDFKNVKSFNDVLNDMFIDKDKEIDGLSLSQLRPVLFKGSTLQEVKAFGEKYGIVVPRRLKKEQLLEVVYLELTARGELTEDLKNELKKKSVVMIQRYATDHGIKVSTELKKDEIIEYILEFSHQTKSIYTSPQPGDYELEIDDPFEFETMPDTPKDEAKSPIIPIQTKKDATAKKTKQSKETPKESPIKTKEIHQEQTLEDIKQYGGTPLVLDRSTAKFLKLYAISKQQRLMILPDKKYHKKRRTFRVLLDDLGNTSEKKNKGLIGELLILKLLALILLRTFIFVLSFALVLGFIFVGYAAASYFINNETLNMINDQINGFEILGKGLIEHIFDVFEWIGI
jgi:hypothetical protein